MQTAFAKFAMLMQQRRYGLAEAEARQMIGASPEDDDAYGFLADALSRQNKHAQSLDAATEAVRLMADAPIHHYRVAVAEFYLDRLPRAMSAIQRALELDVSEAEFHQLQSVIYLHSQKPSEALRAAEAGLAISPTDSGCLAARSDALHAMGKLDDAKVHLYRLLAESPNDESLHCRIGEALISEGKADEAQQHFREALRLDPEFERARLGLIESLKARNYLYAQLLRLGYLANRLPTWLIWGGLIVAILMPQLLARIVGRDTAVGKVSDVFTVCVMLVSQLPLMADAITTLLLRADRRNRMILTDKQRRISNWEALMLATLPLLALMWPWSGRLSIIASVCIVARSVDAVQYVFVPPSHSGRRRLGLLFVLGLAIGFFTILLVTPPGTGITAAILSIAMGLDFKSAVKASLYLSAATFILSIYGCFEVLEHWAPRLARRDFLSGTMESD